MCFQEMEGERDSLDKSPASIVKDNMVAVLGVLTLLNFLFCIPTYRDLSWTENCPMVSYPSHMQPKS